MRSVLSLVVVLSVALPASSTALAQSEPATGAPATEVNDEASEVDADAEALEAEASAEDRPEAQPDSTGAVIVLVTGAVLVAGSAVLFGAGAAENDAVQSAPMGAAWADYAGRQEAANGLITAGGAAVGLGIGMIAVGSLVLAAAGAAGRADHASLEISIGPGSLEVRGTF